MKNRPFALNPVAIGHPVGNKQAVQAIWRPAETGARKWLRGAADGSPLATNACKEEARVMPAAAVRSRHWGSVLVTPIRVEVEFHPRELYLKKPTFTGEKGAGS